MTIHALRCRWEPAGLRVAAFVLAAAAATVLPLATAVVPATAAVRALPGQTATDPGPAGRVWTSWADDPAMGQVVLFGGDQAYRTTGPDDVIGSTWTWDGTTWTKQQPTTAPSPRTGAAMVYDTATGQLLLFGGSRHPFTGGGYLGDTWTWDGTTWTQLHPATSPPPRDTHSLVYDPASQTAILFGGYNGERLSDTWSWDGTTWTQLSPATSPGTTSAAWQAAYDDASQQLVLYGGDANTRGFSNVTWTWTGTTWAQLQPAASAGRRAYGSLTYDPALQRLVMFGGSNQTRDLTSLWEWNGSTWQQP